MNTSNVDPYELLIRLYFEFVPEAKTLDDLSELEAEAKDILSRMTNQAHTGVMPRWGSGEAFGELRINLGGVLDEIFRLGVVKKSLRFFVEHRSPDQWADLLICLLNSQHKVDFFELDEKHRPRIETPIREAFPDAFATVLKTD